MPLSAATAAKDNILKGSAWMQKKPSVTHFLMVRIGSPPGQWRIMFAKKYTDVSPQKLALKHKEDEVVVPTEAAKWFKVRGAVRVSADGAAELILSVRDTNEKVATKIVPFVKELKKQLAAQRVIAPGLNVLLEATPQPPQDITNLGHEAANEEADSGDGVVAPDGAAPDSFASAQGALNAWRQFSDASALELERLASVLAGADEAARASAHDRVGAMQDEVGRFERTLESEVEAVDRAGTVPAAKGLIRELGGALQELVVLREELGGLLGDVSAGVAKPEGTTLRDSWAAAAAAYEAVAETVGGQMTALGAELAASDDTALRDIAKLGLPAVMGGHRAVVAGSIASLRQLRAPGSPPEELRANVDRARQAVQAYLDHLADHEPMVDAISDHPFSAAKPALDKLIEALVSLWNKTELHTAKGN